MNARVVLTVLLVTGAATLQANDVSAPDFKGRLARGVYWPSPDMAHTLKALSDGASGEVRERVESAATRVGSLPDRAWEPLRGREAPLRRHMVRGMVVLHPATPDDSFVELAGAIASEAPTEAEHNCYSANLRAGCDRTYATVQAQWAETYLKQHRDSPVTGYLYGFLMTRHRLAYEYATQAGDIEARKAAAKKIPVRSCFAAGR